MQMSPVFKKIIHGAWNVLISRIMLCQQFMKFKTWKIKNCWQLNWKVAYQVAVGNFVLSEIHLESDRIWHLMV